MKYNVIIFTDITNSITAGIPLGPYKCAHVLRNSGFSCLVINHLSSWPEDELKHLLNKVIGQDTYLIGFSTTFLENCIYDDNGFLIGTRPGNSDILFPQGKDFENSIFQHIKSINPNLKVCVGGAKATPNNANPNVDFVVLGYSETSIVNLAQHLKKKINLKKSYRSLWGKTIIDDKTAADYDFVNSTMSWKPEDVVNHLSMPLEIARGCIFKCKFCSYPMNGKQQLDFVRASELLKTEMTENYSRYGIYHYLIVDDTFNDHREKLLMMRDLVKTLDFQPVFWAYHRLDLICTRPDTLQLLYDIGVRSMFFGIETLNPITGKIIGKGFDRKKQIEMIRHIKQEYPEISLHGSFIIGLPEEPVESIVETFQQIRDREIPLDSWLFNALQISRSGSKTFNSEITNDPANFGYQDLGDLANRPGMINWRNQYLDYSQAESLSQQFMEETRAHDNLKLSGQIAMELSTMGLDFYSMKETPWKSVDWHSIRTQIKPEFQKKYRELLNSLVSDDT